MKLFISHLNILYLKQPKDLSQKLSSSYGYSAKSAKKLTRIISFILLFSSLGAMNGCDVAPLAFLNEGKTSDKADLSVDELQVQLDTFEEVFASKIKSAAAEIDRLSEDPKTKKMTLLWRSRAIAALHNIREQPQPMVVLIDNWLLCMRLKNFIESGEAANAFGDFQSIAIEANKELEAQIEDIARNVLPEELFNQTAKELNKVALANPIQSGFAKTLIYSKIPNFIACSLI